MKPTYRLFVATWFVVSPSTIHAQTWDGSGTPDSGGSWSTALNWTTDTVPTTGNTAVLDTTGANRVVTYDASASGSLGTLTINQTSGFTNTIDLVRSGATLGVPTLTIANAIVLGASGGGTSVITLSPGALNTGHVTLAATAGITINSGGSLIMGASTTTSLLSQINGNVTLTTGGSITISAAEVASTRQRVFNNNYTQNGGNINLDAGTIADTRLQINGTTNITGGTITAGLPSNTREALFSMGGGTNTVVGIGDTINTVIFALGGGTQTLTTDNQSISTNGLVLRSFGAGSYNKTITHNAGGAVEVGQLRFGQNTAGARTALILGSNMSLRINGGLPTASFGSTSGAVEFGIDLNGKILDLTSNTGTWTPNNAGTLTGTTNWFISSTTAGGTLKAAAFNFTGTGTQVNVAAGATLESTSTTAANVLSGGGTIDATSTFLYSGAATTGAPATLASTRSIGNLTVNSGALKISGSAVTAAGLLTIGSGATLDLSGFGLTSNGLTFNNGLLNTSSNLTIVGTGKNVLKTGASTLILSNSANSYTGTTTLQDGTLQFTGDVPVSGNSSLGNASSAIIMGTGSSTTAQRIILSTTTASAVGRAIDATSGTSVASDPNSSNRYRISQDNSTGATLTLNGNVSWGSTGGLTVTRALEITALKSGSSVVVNGVVSSTAGAGALLINGGASGLGSVALNNTANSFSQAITVNNGSLIVGGNAPATTGNSVLGIGNSSIILGDGGTSASNWTTTGSNELLYGQNGNPAMLIAGGFTVARGVSLGNAAGFSGGNSPAVTGNGVPNSYVLGGSNANASFLSGAVAVNSTSANKLLNLTQATGGTFTLSGLINPNGDATGTLNVEINAQKGLSSASTAANYQYSGNAGTVILTNNNTYDGTTTVSAGKLVIAGNHTGIGQVMVNNAGTVQFGDGTSLNGSSVNSGTIFVNNTGTVAINKLNGGTVTNQIASNPSATTTLLGLNATGTTNTFTATAYNNFSVANGAFAITSTSAGAILALTGGTAGVDGAIDLKSMNLSVGGAGDTLIGGVGSGIYGSGGSVTKAGTGTLIYQANNGYTGTTVIDAGAVRVDVAQTNSGTYFVGNGGTTTTAASLLLGGGSAGLTGGVTFNRAVTVNSGSAGNRTLGGTNTSGTNTFSGNITLNDSNATLQAATNGIVAFNTITAASAQTVAVGTIGNTGTVQMGGTADNVNTAATVNFGTLELNKASTASVHALGSLLTINSGATAKFTGTGGDQIFDSANATVNTGGVFDVNGQNETVNVLTLNGTGISNGGAMINNSGATTSTITASGGIALASASSVGGSANISTSSIISGGNALTKVGTGTVTLGGANSYTGATTITAGTLSLPVSNALSGTSSVTMTGGTLLLGASNTIGPVVLVTPVPFTTGGGATIQLSTGSDFTQTLGSLSLGSGNTVIDFGGNVTGNNILRFAASILSNAGTLQVWNWTGTPGSGTGTDRLYFGTDNTALNGLSGTGAGSVQFFTGSGVGSLGNGTQLADGQLVPVPEASSLLAALALVGTVFRRDGRSRQVKR